MIHVRRYLAALLTLSGLCVAYALVVAPWIEPPQVIRRASAAPPAPLQTADQSRAEWEWLFRPDEWERDHSKVKVIETEQGILLIQDYLPTPDGTLELVPCTIIFYAKAGSATGSAKARRPIVLQAPQGAVLSFDQPLDLGRAQFGRLEKGNLPGPITIFSPPADANSRDGLRITTRNVRLDRGRIFTPSDVEFQYGESLGRGRDLTISLLNESADPEGGAKSSFGGVQALTLAHIDRLHIAAMGPGILGEAKLPQGNSKVSAEGPLELTCRGPFTLDVAMQRARFEDQVEVLNVAPGGAPDRLWCDQLLLEFAKTTKGSESADGSLAGRLQRLLAIGSPAILEAPTSGIRATAASMEHSPASRRFTLKADDEKKPNRKVTQVTLQQLGQHFVASGLQYEMAEAGRLGRLWAAGPGELRLLQEREQTQQPVVVRWDRELLVRPDGKNQVISLAGAASVVADPVGRFDADELHIWVLEVAVENSSAAPKTESPPRTTIVPERLLASGNVRLASPQLDMNTNSLKAWFINLPPAAASPPAAAPVATASAAPAAIANAQATPDPSRQPAADAGGVVRPPNLQKFHVRGEQIQMQLVVRGQKFELEDLTIDGRAEIEETRTPEEGQEPIRVSGKSLELRRGTTAQATIQVHGQRAELKGRGVTLAGETIHVHRGENQARIDGPGEATLPVPEGSATGGLPFGPPGFDPEPDRRQAARLPAEGGRPPQRLHVNWLEGLTFDGQTAKLKGNVECRTATQQADSLAVSRTLDVALNRRIDFGASQSESLAAEVARLRFDGGVLVKNWGFNERRVQTSLDQMQVPNLTFDRLAGTLHADGPGWVHTVRRAAANLPGAPQAAPAFAQPAGQAEPLTSIHVAFEHALEGDLTKRQIRFVRQVRTTYSPAPRDFDDLIVAERLADLDQRGVLMTSDRLTIVDMLVPGAHWVELEATGNIHLEGQGFTVQAASVGYTSDKEVLTIRGDGRADAQVWQSRAPGEAPTEIQFQRGSYNLRTGEFDGGGFKRIELQNLGAIRLRAPPLPPPPLPQRQ